MILYSAIALLLEEGDENQAYGLCALPCTLHSPAVRDYFLGEQLHRTLHRDMVDQPSPVEVADKLLHREFLPQRPDPFHAVVRVAEDPHLPINALEGGLLDAGPQLLVRLVALDWGIG